MDRETAVKMWRDAGGSSAGLSGNLPMEMVIEQFAQRVEDAERQRWSLWCSTEIARNLREVDATGHQRHRGAAAALERAVRELGGPNVRTHRPDPAR